MTLPVSSVTPEEQVIPGIPPKPFQKKQGHVEFVLPAPLRPEI